MSPGEQQRLAWARILLTRPAIVFLDEATSALDGDTEAALYAQLLTDLPDTTIVSIAHRQSVAQYHQTRWLFTACDEDARTYRMDCTLQG